MTKTHDWVNVVSTLNLLTLEGKLTWERMDPPAAVAVGVNDRIFNFFGTRYRGRNIGIHEERYMTYNDDLDRYIWQNRIVLAFYTDQWDLQIEVPKTAGLGELFATVRRKEANVEKFVSELLSESAND